MSESDKDHELSASVELTESGFKARLKSRAASALDRLWGSRIDKKSTPIAAENAEIKAVADARVRIIGALTDVGVERLKNDPEFAARAVENFLPSLIRRQENKDAVVEAALEDLRATPPSEDQQSSGLDELSDAFLNRFERYAEDATSEELRQRWGRVLAAEIRKPNTFSGKVLRVIDELEPETAQLFEKVCIHRLDNVVPRCLVGELSFSDASKLTTAGLLYEPGTDGHMRQCGETSDVSGVALWAWRFGGHAIALSQAQGLPMQQEEADLFQIDDKKPAIRIYVLTDVGHAISSILPDNSDTAIERLYSKISDASKSELRRYLDVTGAGQWRHIHTRPAIEVSER